MLVCLPLAAPIGLSPLHILTHCGPKRVLVVSTEPLDDLSCLTTLGSAVPEVRQTALADYGAEDRKRQKKGQQGKNYCGCQKPLSGKLSCRCTHQRAQVRAGVGKPSVEL